VSREVGIVLECRKHLLCMGERGEQQQRLIEQLVTKAPVEALNEVRVGVVFEPAP